MIIRKLEHEEKEILKDFTYEAIFIPEGFSAPDRNIVNQPELKVYHEGFYDASSDCCLVAETGGEVVGAVWSRIMDDYGHVDDKTPSIAIAVIEKYRNRGIGSKLLNAFLNLKEIRAYDRVSLSVQKANYAVRMYEKAGFKTARENGEELIMIYDMRGQND